MIAAPSAAMRASRSRSGWMSSGARSGASTASGCGWNVSATADPPSRAAVSAARRTIAWCPRCTPSKLPRVRTARSIRPGSRERWRMTRMGRSSYTKAGRPPQPPSVLELGELLSGVGRSADWDEEVPLRPERRGRLVSLGIAHDHGVELRDRLLGVPAKLIAPRRPVERVVGERRVLVVGGKAVELRDRAAAVLAREPVEDAGELLPLGHVPHGPHRRLLARHLPLPLVRLLGRRRRDGGRRARRRGRRPRLGRHRPRFARRLLRRSRSRCRRLLGRGLRTAGGSLRSAEAALELGEPSLEVGYPVIRGGSAPARPLFDRPPQPLELALDLLELAAILEDHLSELAVPLHAVGAGCAAAGAEQEQQSSGRCAAPGHLPRITAWTRRLRAQQLSVSSRQSGSSSP